MYSTDKKLVLSSKEIDDRIQELGKQIADDYRGKDLVVIGVLKGAFVFMADLVRAIPIPLSTDFIQVSSYGCGSSSSGEITLVAKPAHAIKEHHILLVEDIVDTGLTMHWLKQHFLEEDAASVRICSLIDKSERREHSITIDYPGFPISDGFLVGYGLDYNEKYRNLPEIFHLNIQV
jgi:hypoxanthine phosphoribosyltransferase